MDKHSPEPWSVPIDEEGWLEFFSGDGKRVMSFPDFLAHGGSKPSVADAERIVACVNACRGFSTEALEGGVFLPYASQPAPIEAWEQFIKEKNNG